MCLFTLKCHFWTRLLAVVPEVAPFVVLRSEVFVIARSEPSPSPRGAKRRGDLFTQTSPLSQSFAKP